MDRSKNNETKRKQDVFDHHPYNTLKDNTSSVPGSSNTVKGKPAAGGPAEKVPLTLYNFITAALAARKVWEARRDQRSELYLQRAERVANNMVYFYTHIVPVLPRNWKYNPDTACTLEPIETIPVPSLVEESEKKKMKTKSFVDLYADSDSSSDYSPDSSSDSSGGCGPDVSPIVLHKLIDVPLKEDDIGSWLQFKKFDEGYYPTSVPGSFTHKLKIPVNIQHPFVMAVGYFAVNCFNEAFKEFVDKGEHNHIRNPAFTDCTYFNTGEAYWFNMNILADEYGFRGIYTARVECTIDNGDRTLHRFVLTDIKSGKKECPPKSKSSKDVDLGHHDTGMWARTPSSCFRMCPITYGYDYHNPTNFVFHWTGSEDTKTCGL